MTETVALIVAGGRSIRAGGSLPKQYQNLAGIPMLRRTVQCFAKHPAVTKVRVVLHPEDHALYEVAVKNLDLPPPVHGGPTRQESCRNGLEALLQVRLHVGRVLGLGQDLEQLVVGEEEEAREGEALPLEIVVEALLDLVELDVVVLVFLLAILRCRDGC